MALTDNELCMIEQLCYLDGSVAEAAGIKEKFNGIDFKSRGKSIEEILKCFDESALKELEQKDSEIGSISAKEWASIIRYLKQNERIRSLKLSDTMSNTNGETLALCFTEEESSGQAVVAFRGTLDGKEWVDNVEGLNQADTDCQLEALCYIENLSYKDITVIGHSKGGNKAMYVSVLSEKVKRCVSFDGQGFSQEFIDKYWAEIHKRAGNIKNYSLSTDYVHALMFPIPNSQQIYCQGFNVENVGQHHSPNSFFKADSGENLILDSDGNPIFVIVDEDDSIRMLHDFTIFVMNQADNEDKKMIISYLSQLLSMVCVGDKVPMQEVVDFILSDPDTLAIIIAYLAKFMDEYDLDAEDIDQLLDTIGLNILDKNFEVLNISVKLKDIINYAKLQLNDENDDVFLKNILLPVIKLCCFKDVDVDVTSLWSKIDSKVRSINVTKGTQNYQAKTGEIHDFSQKVYNILMGTINKINNCNIGNLNGWNQFAPYEWFSRLFVNLAIKGINAYADNLIKVNREHKGRIEKLFADVAQIDNKYASRIKEENYMIQKIERNLTECAAR